MKRVKIETSRGLFDAKTADSVKELGENVKFGRSQDVRQLGRRRCVPVTKAAESDQDACRSLVTASGLLAAFRHSNGRFAW